MRGLGGSLLAGPRPDQLQAFEYGGVRVALESHAEHAVKSAGLPHVLDALDLGEIRAMALDDRHQRVLAGRQGDDADRLGEVGVGRRAGQQAQLHPPAVGRAVLAGMRRDPRHVALAKAEPARQGRLLGQPDPRDPDPQQGNGRRGASHSHSGLTLWQYIEQHKDRAARRERLRLQAREWKERKGLARLFGLAGWSGLFGFRGLAAPGSIEQRYLRWSTGRRRYRQSSWRILASSGRPSLETARASAGSGVDALGVLLGKQCRCPSPSGSPRAFEMGEEGRAIG